MKQQIVIINMHNSNWYNYIKELNELLQNGWQVISQTAVNHEGEGVFSYILEKTNEI